MNDKHPEIDELNALLRLLQIEKEEDFEQHKRQIQRLPLEERVKEGYSWYPVQVVKTGYALGDRAYVIVERSQSSQKRDQFRDGMSVALFTRQPSVKHPEAGGIIQYVDRGKMKIILNSPDLPEWLGLGLIGVDLQFDERTYLEMEKAVKKVIAAQRDRLAELRSILLGRQAPRFRETHETIHIDSLNESQNQAVNRVLAAEDVAVIHGPPGTGKTTTLVQAVKLLAQREASVLVTASSNTAVDLLTERLAEAGLAVIRIGNLSRIDESILSHTLDYQVAQHPDTKTIKKIKVQAAEIRRKAKRYRRQFGQDERDERKALFREASELTAWANQMEERLVDQLLSGAQVIACTLVGASNNVLEGRRFRTVVIDEAAQALEPATWIPIGIASKVVLAGDPFQLPPTIKSYEARKGGLDVTLMEKLLLRQTTSTHLLNVQYRMHQLIMGFSNQRFYQGQLQAAPTVATHCLPGDPDPAVLFIDTAGCGFEELVHPAYQSRYNPAEFQILCEHLYQLAGLYQDHELPSFALISPYKEQTIHMQHTVATDSALENMDIVIQTIDGFQGQERDVVYISLVRSNNRSEIGFLSDYRRMNVALTRARKKLVVIGDSATIGADPFYAQFITYCELHNGYQTAWAYMR